jgi:hypothetical protein
MGRLIASINVTLDGRCDRGDVIADDELHAHATDEIRSAGALLFGRVTYELFLGNWQAARMVNGEGDHR